MENYIGREQSFIKHRFLTQYLKYAAYKILQSRNNEMAFNFVDAFAGPWSVSDTNDYSDASFEQSLKTLENVQVDLGRKGQHRRKIRFCLCEKRPEAIEQLRNYAAQRQNFEIHVFEGKFEENLEKIFKVCRNGFTFTFIDPTGWNIESAPVFQFLAQIPKGEFLLNFMSESINRHAEFSAVRQSFARFLANPEWEHDYQLLPKEWRNEERVQELLIRKIKESHAASYVIAYEIKRPRQDRKKMTLLLGTNSKNGVSVFREVQKKIERVEITTRTNIRDGNQHSLLSNEMIADMVQGVAGVDCDTNCRKAKKEIQTLLRKLPNSSCRYDQIEIQILESIPITSTKLKKILKELKNDKVVSYDLPERKRVPCPNTHILLLREVQLT